MLSLRRAWGLLALSLVAAAIVDPVHSRAVELEVVPCYSRVTTHYEENGFGRALAVGDVNGDTIDDLVVGADFHRDDDGFLLGAVYVYHGSSTGPGTSADWSYVPNVSQSAPRVGSAVAAADVNDDGIDDVVVGANQAGDGGAVYVFYGSGSGPSADYDWSYAGPQLNWGVGTSLATVDVNGDDIDDVIVGAPGYDNGEDYEGGLLIFHGSSSGLPSAPSSISEADSPDQMLGRAVARAGRINGDAYDDVIAGGEGINATPGRAYVFYGGASGLSTSPAWSATDSQAGSNFGWAVAGAGDVDGNGWDDVLVGAPRFDGGDEREGRVTLYKGSGSGLSVGATYESDFERAEFGWAVYGVGDQDGDNYDDFVVGAPGYHVPHEDGRAFLYSGGPGALVATSVAKGDSNSTTLGRSIGLGDVNDDAVEDIVLGAVGDHNGAFWVYDGCLCVLDPPGLDYGATTLNEAKFAFFDLTNTSDATINGLVSEACLEFQLMDPVTPYSVDPDDTIQIEVWYKPLTEGTHDCTVETGHANCDDLSLTGAGHSGMPVCAVSTSTLSYGSVTVGQSAERSFTITNTGAGALSGNLTESSPHYVITSGAGPYDLTAGQSVGVDVLFRPTSAGVHDHTIATDNSDCGEVAATGAAALAVVPALGTWGLALASLLLLASGRLALGRRRSRGE